MRQRIRFLIDELVQICGFFGGYSRVNNYYNCDHPKQEETEFDDELGREVGKCLRCSCPVASHIGPDSGDMMRIFDEELLLKLGGHRP